MFQYHDDIVTIDQLCEMLAIGKITAYKLIRDKKIHSFTIGRSIRIPKKEVITYIMERSNYTYHS